MPHQLAQRTVAAVAVGMLWACSNGAAPPPQPAASLCEDLRSLVPQLRSADVPARARILLVVDLSGYYQRHQNQRPMRSAVVDSATSARCPDVRRDVLAAIDKPSFRAFFAY
jgi:hypothetical protein